ncbi:MFS transporter [Clostridiaceae bacterium M8S5]|nr:MFS transporter [Clostridiaceae bacterium M8S5]
MKTSLFTNRNFILTILGRFISRVGTYFQSFALSLFVLNTTGDPKLFASVLAVAIIPQLVFGPFAGVIIDRYDRKKIIVFLDLLSGLVMASFIILYVIKGTFSMLHIYAIEILLNLINAFFSPAIGTVIPNIIDRESLPKANSINSFLDSIANIASPVLAGLIYGLIGLLPLMIINSISFILSAISEMFIELPKSKTKKEKINLKNFVKDLKEGINYIFSKKDLLALCIAAIFVNFGLSPFFSIVVPFIAKNKYSITDSEYGTFMSIIAIGMIIGPLLANFLFKKLNPRQICVYGFSFVAVVIFAGATIFIPSIQHIYSSKYTPLALLAIESIIVICVVVAINISMSVNFQRTTSNEFLGRVGSVFSTIVTASVPVGQISIGFLLKSIAMSYLSIIIGIFLLIGAIIYYLLSKDAKSQTT